MKPPVPARTTVITTRPAGQGGPLRAALRRAGLEAHNLPALRLAPAPDPRAARAALARALAAPRVVFTSPAAVRHARALHAGAPASGARVIAVGSATGRALRRAGWGPATVPGRADSEGMLALPELREVAGLEVAIVGAPGGRQLLGKTLAARGAEVFRAHVYVREPARLDARHWRVLDAPERDFLLTVTSSQTFRALAGRVPAARWQRLLRGTALASSPRLAALARTAGFARVRRARSATDADLLAAIRALF